MKKAITPAEHDDASIAQRLSGARIGVSGGTGFLGTALIERLLWSIPNCEVVALIRPSRRSTAADRLKKEVLRNDAFGRLREKHGDKFDEQVASRIKTISGDVTQDRLGLSDQDLEVLASCDVFIHSAATVSFNSPLDTAVNINLLGPTRVAQTLREAAAKHRQKKPLPHLITVSTAYVNGSRRGEAPEKLLIDTPLTPDADWRAEVEASKRLRADYDAASRDPKRLDQFHASAHRELGPAGIPPLAERAEKLRQDWVDDQMVAAGKSRGINLGWPDVYAYTKALAERALLETREDLPVSFVRPSIIESAYGQPFPGWIRGFRMAEPIIIAYGRGMLKMFPGIPEGAVDVVPVDFVVAALIAVAAKGPDLEKPRVVQVASGSRHPLRYRQFVDLTQNWFAENPIYDNDGQPIITPEWGFPARGKVKKQLGRALKGLDIAERVLSHMPLRGEKTTSFTALVEKKGQAERAYGYVEQYGAYVECEATYRVDNLLELYSSLSPEDKKEFCFDPVFIDWQHYVQDIHLPSVVTQGRVRTTPTKKTGESREDRQRRNVLSPERQLAVFDLENTIIASNVVESFSWLATRRMDSEDRIRFTLKMISEVPTLWSLDRRDRGDFLRYFYRRYNGASVERIRGDSWEMFSELLLMKSFPGAIRRIRAHKELGHRTLLITGALDFAIEPLRPLFDDIVCPSLRIEQGKLTDELTTVPPTGESRAMIMHEYAEAEGLRLDESVAYADSASDLPMLEAVGFPVAVNPEPKLAAVAQKRAWLTENWTKSPGAYRQPFPMGPLVRKRKKPKGGQLHRSGANQ